MNFMSKLPDYFYDEEPEENTVAMGFMEKLNKKLFFCDKPSNKDEEIPMQLLNHQKNESCQISDIDARDRHFLLKPFSRSYVLGTPDFELGVEPLNIPSAPKAENHRDIFWMEQETSSVKKPLQRINKPLLPNMTNENQQQDQFPRCLGHNQRGMCWIATDVKDPPAYFQEPIEHQFFPHMAKEENEKIKRDATKHSGIGLSIRRISIDKAKQDNIFVLND